jgi:hypothetical protein
VTRTPAAHSGIELRSAPEPANKRRDRAGDDGDHRIRGRLIVLRAAQPNDD